MWGEPFYESFSKLYFNIYIRYLSMLLIGCQSSCHLKSERHCFSDYAKKSHFIWLFLNINLGELIYACALISCEKKFKLNLDLWMVHSPVDLLFLWKDQDEQAT